MSAVNSPEFCRDGAAEIHIAGLLVQSWPERVVPVAAALAALPGTEVRTATADGRCVVVCEGDSGGAVLALIERIRDLPGVLNVALVYQHAESAAAMEEEIGHEDDPPGIH